MKTASIPANETERLSALKALGLLDTPPEERFDRITRLVQHFFDVETVLISLVDSDRQWFKSRQGMVICQTERTISFCAHTILQTGVLEVSDTLADERFKDNPLVSGQPFLRFYAGVPLMSVDGYAIGTLCIFDPKPRQLSLSQHQALLDFGATIEEQINAFLEKQLRDLLAASEARNQAMLDTMPDIVVVVDSQGHVLFCPEHKDLPVTPRAMFGCGASALMPQGLIIRYREAIEQALTSSGPVKFEYVGGTAADPIHYEARLTGLNATEVLILVRNISQEKAAAHQIERLSRVAKETTNAVVITDPQGRVEWINEGFTRITGYTLEDMHGHTPGQKLQGPDTDPATVLKMRAALRAQEPFEVDVLNYARSGTAYWLHIACSALRSSSGDLQGYIAIQSDITPQKRAEAAVNELLCRLKKLTANLPGMIYQFQRWPDGHSSLPYTSEGLTAVYGIPPDGLDKDSTPMLAMIHPGDRERIGTSIALSDERQTVWHEHFRLQIPSRLQTSSQAVTWVEGRATPERLEDGSTLWHGFLADISDRKSLEQARHEQALHTQAILDNVVDGIITVDESGTIISVNPAAQQMFGYEAQQLVGEHVRLLMTKPFPSETVLSALSDQDLSPSIGTSREVQAQRKNGQVFPMDLAVSRITRDGDTLYIGIMRDISRRKDAETEINSLAFYDPLTHLPNRRLFYDRLEHARSVCKRSKNYGALLFIDLDNFKRLNDTAGHLTGDRLLQQVAKRLLNCVREADTVARLGGDEFVVILETLGEHLQHAAAYAEAIGEKIRLHLSEAYTDVHPHYEGTPSIGVTLFFDNSDSVEEIVKQADMAMYEAKAAGRNTLVFYDPQMQAELIAHATMENELRGALHDHQFQLFYQVQVDVDGAAIGAEALLRWCHPVKGWVLPSEFIPLAEETRLILPIGRWALQTACNQLAAWATRPETEHLTLAVNISALQLAQPDFVEQVLRAIKQAGADAGKIKLELTESLLASNIEDVIAKMTALRSKDVGFSLDDFGTGYSSLAYLKRMPIEQLKIDQSFVRDILVDHNDKVIAQTIIALAKSMGLSVIAEGVETPAHRDLLIKMGCLEHQGYLFGRPLPIDAFEKSLGLNREPPRLNRESQ